MFLRNLRYVVVDECHYYRGIFGSNVAMVLRRLLRLCDRYRDAAQRYGLDGPDVRSVADAVLCLCRRAQLSTTTPDTP